MILEFVQGEQTMYEELVKRLREVHPEEYDNKWDFAYACQQTMNEAANVIESLSQENSFLKSMQRDLIANGNVSDKDLGEIVYQNLHRR